MHLTNRHAVNACGTSTNTLSSLGSMSRNALIKYIIKYITNTQVNIIKDKHTHNM